MEEWAEIPEFPGYEVSSIGRIRKTLTGRIATLSPNQFGEMTVGMTRDGKQYRRSVKRLVAVAFVPVENDTYDTPVLLDGDKRNVAARNIAWRPRWFAWEYTHQFDDLYPTWYYHGPIVDRSGNGYLSIIDCAMRIGSLCRDIRVSLRKGTRVYPGGEVFTYTRRQKDI